MGGAGFLKKLLILEIFEILWNYFLEFLENLHKIQLSEFQLEFLDDEKFQLFPPRLKE